MSTNEFTAQFTAMQKALFAFALKLTKDQEAAHDLVQETAFKAYKYRSNYKPHTNIRAWLMTIMRNAFINEYRKRKRRQTYNDYTTNDFFIDSGDQVVPNLGESHMTSAEIWTQIKALDEGLRIPFLMHLQGYKYEEIAGELGVPLGTIKSRIFFARKRLQKNLSAIFQTDRLPEILN